MASPEGNIQGVFERQKNRSQAIKVGRAGEQGKALRAVGRALAESGRCEKSACIQETASYTVWLMQLLLHGAAKFRALGALSKELDEIHRESQAKQRKCIPRSIPLSEGESGLTFAK